MRRATQMHPRSGTKSGRHARQWLTQPKSGVAEEEPSLPICYKTRTARGQKIIRYFEVISTSKIIGIDHWGIDHWGAPEPICPEERDELIAPLPMQKAKSPTSAPPHKSTYTARTLRSAAQSQSSRRSQHSPRTAQTHPAANWPSWYGM